MPSQTPRSPVANITDFVFSVSIHAARLSHHSLSLPTTASSLIKRSKPFSFDYLTNEGSRSREHFIYKSSDYLPQVVLRTRQLCLMAEETTLSALNLISVDDGNSSSSAGNDSNGTDSSSGYNRGLALFVLPQIPGWVAFLYLSMLSLSIIIGVPGNLITVAAYARIKVGHT